jgi:predicted HTH domain antitoxin
MPKKIRFEWDLPDALVDAVAPDEAQLADTIKQAAVLDWVRTGRLSLRRGAELLGMPYRAFLELMEAHRIPSITYEEGWLERELDTLNQERGSASS